MKIIATLLAVSLSIAGVLGVSESSAEGRSLRKSRVASRTIKKVCPNGLRALPFGALWKPVSDVPDQRGGKPVLLLTGSNKTRTSSIQIFSRTGKLLCSFGKKVGIPGINSGADHYYSGWGSGCGKNGRQLGTSVVIGWKGGQCLGPINPSSRSGRIV
jgi:hypothetical protein